MLEKYLQLSTKVQNIVVTGLIIILTAAVFLQVLVRMVLPIPLPWTEEVAGLALLWITYLGLAATFHQNYHIRIDLIDSLLSSPYKKKAMEIFVDILGILFAVLLVYMSANYFSELLSSGQSTSILDMPMWIVMLPVLIGGILTLIHFTLKTLKEVLEMRSSP